MVGPLAIDAYLPSFTSIRETLHTTDYMVQLTLGAFTAAFATTMLFYGTLSDSFGRRKVILWSLGIYTLASLGAALSPNIESLIAFRLLQGLGAGGGGVVARAVVRDRFTGSEAQRMMSQMTMVFGLAPALAPILGGWIEVGLGWRWVFGMSVLFGVVMLWACWRHLPESLPASKRQPFQFGAVARSYVDCVRNPRFMLLIVLSGFAFAGFSIYIGSASHFVVGILGKTETDFGWMFVPLVGGLILGAALASRLAHRMRRLSFFYTAYALCGIAVAVNVGYNLFTTQAQTPWAVLPLFIYSFGISFLAPAVTMSAMDLLPKTQGLASSLQSFVQMMLFSVMVSVVAPLLYSHALLLAFGMTSMITLSFALFVWVRRVYHYPQ